MKRIVLIATCLVGGLATGGAAAFAVQVASPSEESTPKVAAATLEFVPTGAILAPLVFEDGALAGYAFFEVQLQVAPDRAEKIAADMPLLVHAINLQTYRTPLAAGPNGQVPDLAAFRRLVAAAADKAFGRGAVRRVAITQARPA